jgi:hypothetical protein
MRAFAVSGTQKTRSRASQYRDDEGQTNAKKDAVRLTCAHNARTSAIS